MPTPVLLSQVSERERGSKTVVHTSTKTRNDGPCARFPNILSEELVDGIKVDIRQSEVRAAAVSRVKLFFGFAKSLDGSEPGR